MEERSKEVTVRVTGHRKTQPAITGFEWKGAMDQGTQAAMTAGKVRKTDLVSSLDPAETNAALPTPPF